MEPVSHALHIGNKLIQYYMIPPVVDNNKKLTTNKLVKSIIPIRGID